MKLVAMIVQNSLEITSGDTQIYEIIGLNLRKRRKIVQFPLLSLLFYNIYLTLAMRLYF
jgi:hypothetical protein